MKKLLLLLLCFAVSQVTNAQYCTGGPSSSSDSNVTAVTLIGESQSINYTGCPGITGVNDQTASVADVVGDSSYSVDITFSSCGGSYDGVGEAWIDWNSNQIFDSSESIGTWSGTPSSTVQTFTFTVPLTALNGTTRLRVMQRESGSLPLDPCGAYNWGSVDDFSIDISGAFTPSCFSPTGLAISNIAADGAQVSFVSGSTTPSNNYEYELVNTTNGEVADGSTDGTATTNTITLSGLTENDNYEIYIKEICGAGDESDYSSTSWVQIELPGCASNFSPADGSTVYGLPTRFTWDAPTTGGAAISYDFYYGLNGAVADQFLANYTITTAYVNFPAGNHNYLIVPKNVNGAAAVSCSSVNFTIASTTTPPSPAGLTCDAGDVSTSQFTESFDAAGSWSGDFGGAGGWQFDTDSTTSGGTGPTGPQDIGGSYMFYEASSATGSASVVSPVIDLSGIAAGNGAELSFYMHAYGLYMGTLNVGASTSATGPFTNIFTWGGQLQTSTSGSWSQVGADVSAYTGGDLYIQFTMATRGSFYSDMSVDTMEVVACDEAPTCLIPTTLTATISSGGATTIDWVDPNDPVVNDFDYELLDVTAGETATGVPTGQVTTNSVDLTSLVDDNNYQILVRTACSRGGLSGESYSDWSTALSWTQTELPGCVTNLSPAEGETVYTGSTITFTWDAPTTGGTATSYDFYYGLNGAVADQFLANYTVQTATVNGFPIGNHNYLIVAKNVTGSAVSCTSINFTTAPHINDACGGAIDLDTLTSPITASTAGASNDYTGGDCLTNTASPDLFYSVTVPADYTLTIEQTSNAYDSKVRLAYGTSCPGDIVILCQDDLDTDPISWTNDTGSDVEVYYVQSAFSTGSGAFVLAWSLEAPALCPEPTVLVATPVSTTSADLTWTAGGTESLWNIEVYEQGADTSTATPVYTETGAIQNSTTATGLTFGGDYTAYVQADCGGFNGVSANATVDFSLNYCESTPTSNDASGISNVQLGSTDFPTADVTYADYRATFVDLGVGETANLQITFQTGYTYDTNVWIDFNDNLEFESSELVFDGTSQSTNPTTLDASFDIALDAVQGNHYMRIGTADSGQSTPTPCYEGSYGVTIDMAVNLIVGGGCSAITTWDGSAWSNGAPDANSYAVMSGAYSTGTDGAITACVMRVDAGVTIDGATDAAISEVLVMAGNTLTIDETSSLTVSGDFTNTGTVTLNSTADDYSSLIVTGTASGDIVYNRYVNVYDDSLGGGWDLVCSPVGMSIADFITANGSNIQVLGDDYAFSQFNNATGQWERYATASQTGNFEAGKGYSMATTGGSTVAFTGAMQTADQSINIINNNGLNGVGRRWNLVSNPFPSYILGNTAAGTNNFMDANSAVIDSEFLAVYGWNGSSYTIYNQLSGAFSMAPGQGFWVAALNTTDTALNFTAAMRTTTGTGDFVSSPQLLTYNVAVKLYNGEIEKATTDFYFRDGLSLDLDPGYDAAAFNQSMALSTRLPQGSQETAFGINAMGMDAMQNTRVPLEIRQNAGQAFRVSIADMELPEDIYVYLEDTLNGTLTSLKDGDFELVAQSNLSGSDRFFIVFKSNSVLSNGDTLGINALNVYKANTDSFVTIAGISPELGKLNVSLYNILGQTVREKALSSATATQRVSTDGLASGLYIVQIRSGNQTTVKKIIVK